MTTFNVFLAICLTASGAVALLARPLVERAKPSTVVPLLAVGSLISAASMGLLLSLLGIAVLGRVPNLASAAGWSADKLMVTEPVPVLVGVVAGGLAVVLLARAVWRTGRILFLLGRSDRLSRRLRGSGGPIAIIDTTDADADAFTLAGLRGCVVISRQLFAALGAVERQIVTEHELSHLRRHHHLYVHAADIAVAANPVLAPVAGAIRLGVERWADEDAAAVAGNRAAAAQALASTALIRSSLRRTTAHPQPAHPQPTVGVPVLCATSSQVSGRIRALLASAPGRSMLTAGLTAVLIASTAGAVGSTLKIHDGFERAAASCPVAGASPAVDPCNVDNFLLG